MPGSISTSNDLARFYHARLGRPRCAWELFWALLVGYFEGIDSERGIAWRLADSLACGSFWGWRWTRHRRITRRSRGRGD